jgi:DNA-binding NarL/FixJ family response regulator
VLADDHHLVRQGLRSLLQDESDLEVIGEARDGVEAVRLVEQLRPDVLVVDLMMPGLSGLEITREVAASWPETRTIVLSMHGSHHYVLEALRNGAAGYVLKEASADELIRAIREVAEGRRYLSAGLSERVIEAYVQKARTVGLDVYDTLTTREREVLHLAAEGLGNSEIGARLFISARTVETHRASLMRKLGLRSQTDLIRYALRRGILPMEE